MGCDIHLHIEVKVNGKWEHYSQPRIQRNYRLFGLFGCDRDDSLTPVVAPKGIPDDLSLITKTDYEYEEAEHTIGWFNRDEVRQFEERTNEFGKFPGDFHHSQLGYANGNPFGSIGLEKDTHPKEYEDVRFVFWFDN